MNTNNSSICKLCYKLMILNLRTNVKAEKARAIIHSTKKLFVTKLIKSGPKNPTKRTVPGHEM